MKIKDYIIGEKYTADYLIRLKKYFIVDEVVVTKDNVAQKISMYNACNNTLIERSTCNYSSLDYEELIEFYPYKEPVKFPFEVGKTYTALRLVYTPPKKYKVTILDTSNGSVKYKWDSLEGISDTNSRDYEDFYEQYYIIADVADKELKEKLDNILSKYTDAIIKAQQEGLASKDREIENLRGSSKANYSDYVQLQRDIEQKDKTIEELKERINFKDSMIENYRVANRELNKVLQGDSETVEVLNQSMKELQQKYKELNDTKNSYQRANEDLRRNYNGLIETNRELGEKLSYWKTQCTIMSISSIPKRW
jgi:cell division protein FtsB